MTSNYFNSPAIKPTILASLMHTGAFTEGDLLFDWTSFEIPRGVATLIGATVMIRSKGDAGPTPNEVGLDLVFAKDTAVSATPTSLGTVNSPAPTIPREDFIGVMSIEAGDHVSAASGGCTSIATSTTDNSLVFEPEPNSGTNVGVDKYWVGGFAGGAIDFVTLNRVNESNFGAGTQTVITTDGTGMDIREHFIPDDVIHAHDDAVLGTVLTADSATQITLTAANTAAIEDDDFLYCVNPIKIILHFSK